MIALKDIRAFINGIAFGLTLIVPGASGGTVAVILGFYNQLIDSVNNFTRNKRKHLRFLIPFLLGVAGGIVGFASVIRYLLENFSLPVMLFFIGMIAGVIPSIGKIALSRTQQNNDAVPHKTSKFKQISLVTVSAVLLGTISHLTYTPSAEPTEIIAGIGIPFMFFLFFVGIIAAASLVTPGTSGSFVLLLFGVYHVLIYSVASIRHLWIDLTNTALWIDICMVALPFGIGVIIGGISTAKLIGKLLNDYPLIIHPIILGLMIGSVYTLFRDPIVYQSGITTTLVISGIFTFAAGFAISFLLSRRHPIDNANTKQG